jgi:Fur family iron response transcriptional regulator
MKAALDLLRDLGVQPTPQRIAVARFVLRTGRHPTADEVLAHVRRTCPTASRATVYNTLNLLVDRGLLRVQVLRGGRAVFDANTERHHHFIDERTGAIHDVPWHAVTVGGTAALDDFEVRDYQVVMRGRKRKH